MENIQILKQTTTTGINSVWNTVHAWLKRYLNQSLILPFTDVIEYAYLSFFKLYCLYCILILFCPSLRF